MRSLILLHDHLGFPTAAITPSDTVYAIVLTAGVAKSVTVPPAATTVLFAATGPFWAKMGGGDAAIPSEDVLDGSASELAPVARQIAGTSTIGLIAPAPVTVSLAFYA